ncbi:MAG: hypothetical protein QW416_02960 [Candidatus Nitrosocaldaceae archaeon]
MKKPRKPPSDENQKKKLDKKQLLMLPIAASVGLIIVFIMTQFTPKILEECLVSDDNIYSKHIHLEVLLDGERMDIPDDLGFNENCIKPIHLHGENDIHVLYNKEIRITLYEFIKLWNINLDSYEVSIFVKTADSEEFQPFHGSPKSLPLDDKMSIRFELKSKR